MKKKIKEDQHAPNIHISKKHLDLLERDQDFFPKLSKEQMLDNILSIFFSNSGDWAKRDLIDNDGDEYNPKDTRRSSK